ncbi:hypothetical protein MLD38_023806 [Melastoma candidum]|nr:hypothetical protein MLD38_023806 [Melastoma candidum]
MIVEFTPDLLTSTSVLHACGRSKNLEMGKFVHQYMVEKGMELDTHACNILLDVYIKCYDIQGCRELFGNMENRDIVSWNSVIHGFIQWGMFSDAMQLFREMMNKKEVDPDLVTYVLLSAMPSRLADNFLGKEIHCQTLKLGFSSDVCINNALIDMYAKCSETEDALRIFAHMGDRDVITWNTVIASCVHDNDSCLGFQMVRRMAYEGVRPDAATFVGLLPICSMHAAKRPGKEIHGCIFRLGLETDTPIGNALIEMYSNCGSLECSVRVFECLKDKDLVTWTSLISAYGASGLGRKALETYLEMQTNGVNPDQVALVAILDSCSHSGLVDEGMQIFHSMKDMHGLEPQFEHYSCIVDLLSRSGQLSKAEEFIESTPVKANATVWGTLLSACRESGCLEVAERVSRKIEELGSDDPGHHVLVANVYATLGRWDRAGEVRRSIRSKGMRKDPGRSWTEVDGGGTGQFEELRYLKGMMQ